MNLKINLTAIAVFAALAVQADWVYDLADVSIPDGDPLGIQRTIDMSSSGLLESITDIEVQLHISAEDAFYTFDGDFYAFLVCENGGRSVLLNRIGKTDVNPFGYDGNGMNVVFSVSGDDIHILDEVDAALDEEGRVTGTWSADARDVDPDLVVDTDARTAGLDDFAGVNPNGRWTLFIADVSGGGSAKLDYWGINVQAVPEPAVVGMIAVFCGGAIFIRRRFGQDGEVKRG